MCVAVQRSNFGRKKTMALQCSQQKAGRFSDQDKAEGKQRSVKDGADTRGVFVQEKKNKDSFENAASLLKKHVLLT